ncbi:MAG: hypothetical protein KDB27_15120, partial [Planctomycetales bacterium]|nr:hypothetical protein [Planctomycetales bacterium]
TWEEGDWNRDGDFDSADFVEAFKCGGYEAPSLSGGRLNRLAVDAIARTLVEVNEFDADDDDPIFRLLGEDG